MAAAGRSHQVSLGWALWAGGMPGTRHPPLLNLPPLAVAAALGSCSAVARQVQQSQTVQRWIHIPSRYPASLQAAVANQRNTACRLPGHL
jgi:hypothetical protein